MNNTEISNRIFDVRADLGKTKAVLKSLGTDSMYDCTRLTREEQKILLMNHEDCSNLFQVVMECIEKTDSKLEKMLGEIYLDKTLADNKGE